MKLRRIPGVAAEWWEERGRVRVREMKIEDLDLIRGLEEVDKN